MERHAFQNPTTTILAGAQFIFWLWTEINKLKARTCHVVVEFATSSETKDNILGLDEDGVVIKPSGLSY